MFRKEALSWHTLVDFWKLCLFVIQFKCQLFDLLVFVFVPGPPVNFTNNVLCMNCTSALRVSVQQLLQLNCLIITFDLFSCLIIHFWFNRILIFVFFSLARLSQLSVNVERRFTQTFTSKTVWTNQEREKQNLFILNVYSLLNSLWIRRSRIRIFLD